MMQNFEVYQLNFRNAPENLANIMFMPNAEMIQNAREFYQKVAVIEAENYDDVFAISNIGEEEHLINRLAPMHSVSVGDVIVDENGNAVFVNMIGFDAVQFN
jgi:hypothetical protein